MAYELTSTTKGSSESTRERFDSAGAAWAMLILRLSDHPTLLIEFDPDTDRPQPSPVARMLALKMERGECSHCLIDGVTYSVEMIP